MEIQIFVDEKQVIKFISVITLGIIDKYWISYVNFKNNCFSCRTYLYAPLISITFNESKSAHSTLINPTIVQVLRKCDDLERRTGYFRQRKKKVKTKFINLDHAGNDKLLNRLLLSLGCWLMLARRFCVYNMGLKVDAAREILTVIMTSNDENVRSCKRHTVVRHVFCFGNRFALSWPRDSLLWVLINLNYDGGTR